MTQFNDSYRPQDDSYRPQDAAVGVLPNDNAWSVPQAPQPDAVASVVGPLSDVKDAAVSAGAHVTETAKDEAAGVVDEAKFQGRKVLDEGVAELRTQAAATQNRLADTVQAFSDELRAMAGSSEANGLMGDLAGQGHDLAARASTWLRENDPDQVLVSVRRYAARNPWAFLAVAAGAGLVAGRFARGLSAGPVVAPSMTRGYPQELNTAVQPMRGIPAVPAGGLA